MVPDVPPPPGIRVPVDFKLRTGWSYDAGSRTFTGPGGREFEPTGVPRGARVEPKVPALAATDPSELSKPERELRRFMHVIPPASRSAESMLEAIRAWPCAVDVHVASVPGLPSVGRTTGR